MKKIGLPLLLFLSLLSCATQQKYVYEQYLMNTIFEITLYSAKSPDQVKSIADQAFEEIRRIEKKYSSWTPGTHIYQLNQQKKLLLDEEDSFILKECLEMADLSEGSFDVTVLPLMGVWGFRDKNYHVPSQAEIDQALLKVNVRKNLIVENNQATLLHDAMIDLGGILKGYAVDKAVQLIRKKGISAGIVNAGGNLLAFGAKTGQTYWTIGIRHPRREGDLWAVYQIDPDTAMATSGDYERFFILDGKRYAHIMDPVLGRPVANDVISVSVVHPSAMYTDGLSTTLFVMGIKRGLAFAEKNKLPVLFIFEKDGKMGYTNSSYWEKEKMELIP